MSWQTRNVFWQPYGEIPEEGEQVLIFDGAEIHFGEYRTTGYGPEFLDAELVDESGSWLPNPNVTHWMSFPLPPDKQAPD